MAMPIITLTSLTWFSKTKGADMLDWEADEGERAAAQYRVPHPGLEDSGLYLINKDKLEQLTDVVMLEVANMVADLIGAGSEREAVLENETLRQEIYYELRGWSNDPRNAPEENR